MFFYIYYNKGAKTLLFAPPYIEKRLEVFSQDKAYTLCSEGIIDGVVTFIVMAICLGSDGAAVVDEKLQIEVANEGIGVAGTSDSVGWITIADVAIQQQTVIEQSGAEAEVHLHVGKVTTVGTEIGSHCDVVAQMT